MGKRQSPMGLSQTPLGHWIIAVFLAAGVGWGVHAWLSQRAAQSAQTATLSWDPAVARQVEPDLANAAEPAVAMAESILTDSVVASLAQSASLPSSTSTVRIGEFRSRLELRQSSAQVLEVQFRDPDSDRAARIANSVAGTLAAKTSAPASAATAVAPPHPVEKAAPASVKAPVVSPASDASDTLVHSLSELETELSATQQKLDSGAPGQRRERGGESPGYREAKQQQLLTAQVSAALKEVTTLRADPTNSGAAQEPLRQIQEALFSVWPASRAFKGTRSGADFRGFNAAGVNASRLREERAQFAHALEIVQKEQRAVQRLQPVQANEPPPPAPPVSESPAPITASAPSESDLAPGASEPQAPPTGTPFRLLRPAGAPFHSPLWPGILAGFCCGIVYLAVASSRHGVDEEDEETDYADDSTAESYRLITPSKPIRPPDFFGSPNERPSEIVLPDPRIETPDPPADVHDSNSSDVGVQEIVIPAGETRLPFREEVVGEDNEGDPWIDNIMKNLSETSIGKMFERPAPADDLADREAEAERRHSNHPDRLAG